MTEQSNDKDKQESTDPERTIWDVNPLKTTVELSDGKIRMRETAVYSGRLRVSEAVNTSVGEPQCAWVYVQAESRDGADVKLTPEQAKDLRDALNVCIERYESARDTDE